MPIKINGTNTAANPSITGDDTDTGIVYGSDQIDFSTGGTSRANVDSSGNINIPNDSGKIQLGTSADLQIYHNATDSYLQNTTGTLRINNDGTDLVISTDNNIHIRTNGTEEAVKAIANGAVEIYYDNSKKFETNAYGALVSGSLFTTAHVYFGNQTSDNCKAFFGAANDLEIYHSGSTSYIKDTGTGNLRLCTSKGEFRNAADDETLAAFTENGAVELYFDNSKKFETSSTGIKIHGLSTGTGNSDLRYNSSDGVVTYDTSSRLVKTDIEDSPYGIDIVKQLKPRKYKRTDQETTPVEIGFIADEVQSLIPEIVPTGPKSIFTKNDSDTEIIPVNVDYRKLTVVLTTALQEAITKIETLETKVAALEAA